jgi:hypothetical protein
MQHKAIRIYWIGSFLALIEASLLVILGLDLNAEQIRLLPFVLLIPVVTMYLCAYGSTAGSSFVTRV